MSFDGNFFSFALFRAEVQAFAVPFRRLSFFSYGSRRVTKKQCIVRRLWEQICKNSMLLPFLQQSHRNWKRILVILIQTLQVKPVYLSRNTATGNKCIFVISLLKFIKLIKLLLNFSDWILEKSLSILFRCFLIEIFFHYLVSFILFVSYQFLCRNLVESSLDSSSYADFNFKKLKSTQVSGNDSER